MIIANTQKIKSARAFINYSQKDVAEYLELNINSYGAKERGDKQFTIIEFWLLNKLFNDKGYKCTIEELIIDKGE